MKSFKIACPTSTADVVHHASISHVMTFHVYSCPVPDSQAYFAPRLTYHEYHVYPF